MKTTRNLFALEGSSAEVNTVLKAIQFKGLRVFSTIDISHSDIFETFLNNKSIACPICHTVLSYDDLIAISVINSSKKNEQNHFKNLIDTFKGNIPSQFEKIADIYNCDIGDFKANSSGLNGAPSKDDCCYCNFYYKGISKHNQKTIYESPNFFVLATLGEFMYGYVLVIPKAHITSCAELDKDSMDELLEVLDDIIFILKKTYKKENFLIWENGSGNGGIGKAKDSIVHCHVHIAPSSLTASRIELFAGFPLKEITSQDLSKFGKNSYLLIKDGSFWRINDDNRVYIPRQYVRQLLARENKLYGEEWNWRTHPYVDKMNETYYQIVSALKDDWDNVPDRIKYRINIS